MRHLILLLVLLHPRSITSTFSPDTTDFDAYGLKISANDVLFAQAKNQAKTFLVQFAPFNFTRGSLQCNIDFADQSHYVYSVAVGSKQNLTTSPYFYYTGEVLALGPRSTDRFGQSGTLISVMSNRDPAAVALNIAQDRPLQCGGFQSEPAANLSSYAHQEYFVIAVEPYGQYAIGLATDFVFRYQPYNNSYRMFSQNSSTVWPDSATFQPCAADATTSFTIVAGFLKYSGQSRVRAAPTVYLLWNSNLTVLSTWTFTATNNTWQARLAYPNVDSWSNGLTMSVKINGDDPTRVLIGMPFLNTVFLFQVSNNGKSLTMANSMSYNDTVGFGKGVTWLSKNQAAILYSAYSRDSVTWYSSQVYVYTWLNDTTLPSSPTAVIPNAQQPLPSTINAKFIRLVSTPSTVAILDQAGGAILITTESPGLYASTDTTNSPVAAAMPVVSHAVPCIGGMFKADRGIHPCTLCPAGTHNPGIAPATACIDCSADCFCPLGAVYEMEKASIASVSQAVAYPRSPDLTVYEDLLIDNMVSFGRTLHCLRVSPMFWTSILLFIALVILLVMASLNFCVQEPKCSQWRTMVKSVFLRTDLVVSDSLLKRIFIACPCVILGRRRTVAGWYRLTRCGTDHGDGLQLRVVIPEPVPVGEGGPIVVRVRRDHSQCQIRFQSTSIGCTRFRGRRACFQCPCRTTIHSTLGLHQHSHAMHCPVDCRSDRIVHITTVEREVHKRHRHSVGQCGSTASYNDSASSSR